LLLLSAIDTEWRDYLTAMDDLRREVGLEAIGQRDPKVQYKRRSYEMFADMRHNIDKGVADRFFREIAQHQQFIQQQQAEVAYQLQAQEAGFQVVKRERGKGVELRRDMPKVGRNDPCPCGSGKKYKNCHGRAERTTVQATAGTSNGRTSQPAAGGGSSGRKKTTAKNRRTRR
jgi:preprotein translocase subunit SecA